MLKKFLILIAGAALFTACQSASQPAPQTAADVQSTVTEPEEDTTIDPDNGGDTDQSDIPDNAHAHVFVIPETTNDAMVSEGLTPAAKHVKLKITKHKSTDYLDDQEWLAQNNLTAPALEHTDGEYKIDAASVGAEYDYEKTILMITKPDGTEIDFDFTNFYRVANPESEPASFATRSVQYATIKNDILYVSIMHRTYSATLPINAFIMAIDLSGNVLWRSPNLVSNSRNFVIIDDTIVTGYGFTDEPDFLYTLDINTGNVLDKIKVKSGPNYIIQKDGKLLVSTYNTAYEVSYQ